MKYILEIKNINGEVVETKVFKSLLEIQKNINETYASIKKNFLLNVNPDEKPSVKFSQKRFDSKYNVKIFEEF
jgi:hypothetical protein